MQGKANNDRSDQLISPEYKVSVDLPAKGHEVLRGSNVFARERLSGGLQQQEIISDSLGGVSPHNYGKDTQLGVNQPLKGSALQASVKSIDRALE